jgi:hypothetical protein
MEKLHSKRRKYANKQLNFEKIYIIRANIILFAKFINNCQNLILIK